MKKLILGTVLGLLIAGFGSAAVNAQNVAGSVGNIVGVTCLNMPPSCDDLGYTMTEDLCGDLNMLPCPWDSTKVFCNLTCEDLGYELDAAGRLVCISPAVKTTCPMDSSYVKCVSSGDVQNNCITLGYIYTTGSCRSPLVKKTCPINSTYFKCVNESSSGGGGGSSTCADLGYLTKKDACSCQYGYKSTGDDASDGPCYRCGTKSECVVGGGIVCLRCMDTNLEHY